jgi:hypothetical protein
MANKDSTGYLTGYQDWLKREGYQPSTIRATLRHLKGAVNTGVLATRQAHLRRYLLFVKKTRSNPLGRAFTHKLKQEGIEPAAEIVKQGRTVKTLLTRKAWKQLRARLRRAGAGDEGRLLAAYMESPYRIGDFLNFRIADVTPEDTDKAGFKWLQSFRKNTRVYEVLCETERCAYYRLRKKLSEVAEDMGLSVDLDTLYKSYFAVYET